MDVKNAEIITDTRFIAKSSYVWELLLFGVEHALPERIMRICAINLERDVFLHPIKGMWLYRMSTC